MISGAALRTLASEKKIALDLIEKDYLLGWILFGVSQSTINKKIVFKGGTALSKIYYPFNWRISEDLDFTAIKHTDMKTINNTLRDEAPPL